MSSQARYIISFEFKGNNFFGSQKQPDRRTVQGEIEKALNVLTCTLKKDKIKIILSGRTDAKVSAKYQTAHFDSVRIENLKKFLYSLNCILPSDVKVFEIKEVDPNFHAQKFALYKHYRYTILNDHVASAFNDDYLFYPYNEINLENMNKALTYLIGHHDFSAFKSVSDNPYNDCIVYYAGATKVIKERINFIFIDLVGNRFLYNMVRTIVGELLYLDRNNLKPEIMNEILLSRDRSKAANVIDARGLCLEFVGYDDVESYIKNQFLKRKVNNENF